MTTATRCCTCGDEIAPGSDVWGGAGEDETACSMLCRYRSVVEQTNGYSLSREAAEVAALDRVGAAREALLYDPEIFDQEGVLDVTVEIWRGSKTAAMIPIEVGSEWVRLEIVMSGDHDVDDEEVELRWTEIIDMVLRDA